MNTLFFSREQVEELTYEECQSALAALDKKYKFNRPINPTMTDIWPLVDDIVNSLLYLEDRIKRFEDPRIPNMDPESDTIAPPPAPETKAPKQVRKRRRFHVGDVIYESVFDASEKLGLKEHTLRNYVTRDPKKYGYLD